MSVHHDPTAALVDQLQAGGFDPRPTGPDSWESRCPAHNGDGHNLSIKRGDDGRVLVHCHAHGCEPQGIAETLGITMADLFPPQGDRPAPPAPRVNGKARTGRKAHPSPEAAIASIARKQGQPSAHWVYHHADGTEAARVYRFDPPGKRKQFRPVHQSPEGWVLADPPGLWPLYHLPNLAEVGRVYLTEGEKACDLARNLKVIATTSAHGAKSAHKTDWRPLAGRDVVILPDHDTAGDAYAQAVATELEKLTPRPKIRIVRLPELWQTHDDIPEGADMMEWLRDGVPDLWEPEQCRAELDRVADSAPPVDLNPAPPSEPGADPEPPIGPSWPDPPEAPAFDGLAGEIVRAIEPHTEADLAAILVQFLIGFGNLIGRSAFFEVEADRHYTNEFAALVGDTSKARKGTSWSHARRLLDAVDPVWAASRVKPGLSTGEGLIHAVRDPVSKREPIREGPSKRITGYQDVEVDPGELDKRFLCMEPELGGTLRMAGRDGNTLSALARQAFDTGDLGTLTRNSPLRATGAHISIIGHITRDELTSLLTRTDAANGFANRFLWLCVRRSKMLPFGGNLGSVDFAPMLRRLSEAAEAARTRGRMTRDAAADRLWADVYPELSEGRPGLLGAVTSRAEAHTMRLALIYALIDGCSMIHADHLRSGLALWKFAERSAAFIFGDTLGDPDADALLSALRAAMTDGLTRDEIRRNVFNGHKSSALIERKLSVLAAAGLAHARNEPTGGRPAKRWFAGRAPAH